MPTITCKISPLLDARLSAASRVRRTTKSVIVRETLEAELLGGSGRPKPRAYDVVKHLLGSLSGPRDLSHHPRHLEGFGD